MNRSIIYCQFCGLPENEAMMLIRGPNMNFICDGCIQQCVSIIVEKHLIYGDRIIGEVEAAKRAAALHQARNEYRNVSTNELTDNKKVDSHGE